MLRGSHKHIVCTALLAGVGCKNASSPSPVENEPPVADEMTAQDTKPQGEPFTISDDPKALRAAEQRFQSSLFDKAAVERCLPRPRKGECSRRQTSILAQRPASLDWLTEIATDAGVPVGTRSPALARLAELDKERALDAFFTAIETSDEDELALTRSAGGVVDHSLEDPRVIDLATRMLDRAPELGLWLVLDGAQVARRDVAVDASVRAKEPCLEELYRRVLLHIDPSAEAVQRLASAAVPLRVCPFDPQPIEGLRQAATRPELREVALEAVESIVLRQLATEDWEDDADEGLHVLAAQDRLGPGLAARVVKEPDTWSSAGHALAVVATQRAKDPWAFVQATLEGWDDPTMGLPALAAVVRAKPSEQTQVFTFLEQLDQEDAVVETQAYVGVYLAGSETGRERLRKRLPALTPSLRDAARWHLAGHTTAQVVNHQRTGPGLRGRS